MKVQLHGDSVARGFSCTVVHLYGGSVTRWFSFTMVQLHSGAVGVVQLLGVQLHGGSVAMEPETIAVKTRFC